MIGGWGGMTWRGASAACQPHGLRANGGQMQHLCKERPMNMPALEGLGSMSARSSNNKG
jgi:hypothetical protein